MGNSNEGKQAKIEPNQNKMDYKIYFIVSTEYGKVKPYKFSIDKQGYEFCACEKKFIKNNKYETSIFSFKYNKNKIEENEEIYIVYDLFNKSDKYKLKAHDNFLFNIKMKVDQTKWFHDYYKFPTQNTLSEISQYYYYSKLLQEKNLLNTYSKQNLNRDIAQLLMNRKKIEFSLFLDVLKEIYLTQEVKKVIALFTKEKIYIKEKIDPNIHQYYIKELVKDPKKILNLFIKKKQILGERVYLFFIYYFYYVLPKEFPNFINERKIIYKDKKNNNIENEIKFDLVDLFFQNLEMFKQNDDQNVFIMIQYVDSSSNLLYLINQFKSFTNLLKSIDFYKEKIINLLKPEKKIINMEIINLQPEKKDLKINLDNINQIKSFSHLNQFDFLKLPDNLYLNFISMCENMENLDILKIILSTINKDSY